MGSNEFINLAKALIQREYNKGEIKDDVYVLIDDIFCVWNCKTLQNNKGLFAIDIKDDLYYYEVTHNGDKKEIYLDTYLHESNESFSVEDVAKKEQ